MNTIQRSAVALIIVLGPTLVFGQALAPSVQAELLRDKIYTQAKANDADSVLKSLDQYHKLVDDNKLTFPPPLYLIEAKAAHDAGDGDRALAALTEFLNKSEPDSSGHREALALYPQYEQANASRNKLSEDARRQALSARIPEVIAQINASVVAVQGGRLTCPKNGPSVTWSAKSDLLPRPAIVDNMPNICGPIKESNVEAFEVMNRCVPNLWWDVYVVDTGKASTQDGWDGITDCVEAAFVGSITNEGMDSSIALSDIERFVTWVSAKSGKRWRLARERELALLYQQAVQAKSAEPKDENVFGRLSTLNLGGEFRSTHVIIEPFTGVVSRNVGPRLGPTWELTEDCASPGESGVSAAAGGVDAGGLCNGSALAVITLHTERTETIDYSNVKVKDLKNVQVLFTESYALVIDKYPGNTRPSEDWSRVEFRLVRE
jgi:formylglycine-generating enzyme required for sulfatase activity